MAVQESLENGHNVVNDIENMKTGSNVFRKEEV